MITDVSSGRIMAAALKAVALGTSSGDWMTTYGRIPSEQPTRRIGVMTTTPITHGKFTNGDLSQHLGVQITVRSKTQEEGTVKCLKIIERLMLCTVQNPIIVVIDSVPYSITHVSLASGPIPLMTQENKDAEIHTINFLFTVE